jgi:hypothetical protein
MPALNKEPAIGRTLDQVPRGLYRKIIAADNGSDDRTAQIARAPGHGSLRTGARIRRGQYTRRCRPANYVKPWCSWMQTPATIAILEPIFKVDAPT